MPQTPTRHPRTHCLRPLLAVAGLLALLSTPALAQNANRVLCSQPVEPTCVNTESTYENAQSRKRCSRDLEEYTTRVDEYVSCLQEKGRQLEREKDQLRQYFQCRAEGDGDC